MSPSNSPPPGADATLPAEPVDDVYRLDFVRPVRAPSGNTGTDWFTYRIARGANIITGYRRGDIASVTPEVERIVTLLNERRLTKRR